MRTLLLASAALVLAACSDNPQPTAPRSIGSATSGAGADRALINQGAKPVDQVGFTKVVSAAFTPTASSVGPGMSGENHAICPAGTTVVGGGFHINGGFLVSVFESADDGQNGWVVKVYSPPTTPGVFTFNAIAYCLS